MKNEATTAQAWQQHMTGCTVAAKQQVKQCLMNKESLSTLTTNLEKNILATKAATVATKAFSVAGNMIAMWAISKVISIAIEKIDDLAHASEKCAERVDGLMSSYESALSTANSNADKVEELADKYETLSKGVNNLGQNVSLTANEYAEYNDIVNEIADMFPTLIQGYTSEGNAILTLKGNVEGLRDAYKEAQQEAYNMLIVSGEDSDGNDIIENFQNETLGINGLFQQDTLGSIAITDWLNDLKTALNTDDIEAFEDSISDLYKLASDRNEAYHSNEFQSILDDIGINELLGSITNIYALDDEALRRVSDNIKDNLSTIQSYIQIYQVETENVLNKIHSLANAYLMTNKDYADLDDNAKTAASLIVNSIDAELASGFEDKIDVGEYVANIVSMIKDSPNVQYTLNGLFTTDFSSLSYDNAKAIIDQYINTIAELTERNPIELKTSLGFSDYDDNENLVNNVKEKLQDEFDNRVGELTLGDLQIAAEQIEVSDGVLLTWDELHERIEKVKSEAITSTTGILSQIQSLSTGLDQLSKIYADVQDMENFDWSSILNNEDFTKTFGELGSSYNNFIKQISNAPDDIKACQDAFNALATDYIYSAKDENGNNIMSNLTEDTKDATVAMLEQMGVVNALEVVEYQLEKKTSYLSDAKKVQANIYEQLSQSARTETEEKHSLEVSSIDLENVTLEEIDALIAESNALGLDCGSLVAYRMAKFEANRESLTLNNEVNGLLAMAKAAGIATTAVASLGNAKSAYDAAMKSGNEMQAREAAAQMESAKARAEKDILNFEVPQVDLTPKNTTSSKSDSDSHSTTEETAETFNFIETALTRIESAIDRVKSKAGETFRSFTSRSKSYAETISKITDEINLQEQARQKYIERRDSVGLDEYWATQVRDGSLNIADITDDALKEQIQAYENWNDKVIECTKSIDNLKKDQKELVQESIELLITKYEKLAEKVSNSIESVQNRIDLKEAWGGSASVSDYRSMNKSLAKQIGYIQNQNTELKKLQKTVTKGSEAWYDYQEQIDSNNASVQNLTKSMAENAQASAALSKANADKKAEKYDSRDDLNDAKIDNATTAKSKNSLIDKKISNINGRQKAYDNAVTSSTNRLNASISSINSLKSRKTNTTNKTTNKENKTYNTVLKKVKAQIKAGKRIGANLLNDTTALNDNLALYNACVQYNAYLDAKADNETIAEIYAETAKQEKADLALEKFNNIAAEYDYSTSANEQKKTELNNKISLAEAQGRKVNVAYYNGLISAETGEQQKLIQKRNALQKSLDDAVASGQIEKGSEEWYEMIDAINEVTNAIDDSVESVVEYQNAIRQIRWDTFDDSLETVKRIPGENDFYIDFMSKNKDLIDEDSGNFTEYGNAALALHNENYKNYLAQAEAYAKEYNDIMVQVARGELSLDDENVIQRLRELQDAQRDAKLSAEDELSSIVDLVKQGYEAQLNALSELIQKYKDLQQSEKDAYEYQKSIAEKTKNISMLQKQLAAYGGNDTEEARAKIQQIKVDLEEAKQDLKETEYEKYLSDTNDMLDEMYGDYEDFIDQRLKDTDAILETINASIGGMSSSIIATLASLNGGITPELEKLLNGSVSSSDYVNGVIASDKAKQQASMREAEAQKAKEEQQKADEERIQAEEAQRQKEYEAEKARRETNEKREELENQLAIEKRNLVELQNKLSDLKNDAQHELDEINAQRAKKGLKALTSLSNIPGYTKTKQEIEAKIKTAKNNIASIQKQLNDLPQYANGCSYIPYDQLAWTQEKGAEAILRKSDGALLTPLGMGDMVFDNETTHRLLETSKMIPVQLVNGLNHTPVIPALPAIERNVTGGNVSIDLGGINMYGVNDPETFGRQIREEICKNGKTLQCITEGVSSKMTGKGIGSTRLFQ